ncbi:MAG: ZIP family metal transporter [bacterium]|nr:ZIP family metal transporter [bacterium]
MALIIGLATIFSTLLGGLFGIRFKDKLHLILGFSAGAVIGVAIFDLVPESIELATKFYSIDLVTVFMAIGFILYMILDRFFALRAQCHDGEECQNENHLGQLGAAALCLHSFLDGLAIGLAFQVNQSVGWVVATAVLAHDFSDGINTVNMILKDKGNLKSAYKWLVVDALAPAFGVLTTLFFTVPEAVLGLILAAFTGLFLYIGASDLIPESHHRHPAFLTTVMTILGMSVIYTAIHFAG